MNAALLALLALTSVWADTGGGKSSDVLLHDFCDAHSKGPRQACEFECPCHSPSHPTIDISQQDDPGCPMVSIQSTSRSLLSGPVVLAISDQLAAFKSQLSDTPVQLNLAQKDSPADSATSQAQAATAPGFPTTAKKSLSGNSASSAAVGSEARTFTKQPSHAAANFASAAAAPAKDSPQAAPSAGTGQSSQSAATAESSAPPSASGEFAKNSSLPPGSGAAPSAANAIAPGSRAVASSTAEQTGDVSAGGASSNSTTRDSNGVSIFDVISRRYRVWGKQI